MSYVVARAIVKPECLDQYLAAVNEIIPTVLAEDGCIRYEACLDWTEDGSRRPAVIMLETWAGKAHLDAHLAAAHMKEFMQKVAPFREGSELQILKPALP